MMTNCNSEIRLKRGDTRAFQVEALNDDGTPIDITTATVYFTARLPDTVNDPNDTTAKIKIVKLPPHDNPVNGITLLNIDSTDTDIVEYYVREIQIVDGTKILSTEQGDLIIDQDITKTI